jgi:heat shock protein HslJ
MRKLAALALLLPLVLAVVACSSGEESSEGSSTANLEGTTWTWQGTTMNDDTSRTPDDPNKYTITFQEGGAAAVKTDCNNASGTWTVDGTNLTIALGPMTMAECPPGSLYQEFVADLSQVGSYTMDGTDLILMLKMDSGTMKMSPAQ